MNAIFQPLKFCQIPHVILESTNQFFFKFCISLQCHQTKLLYTFLAQTLYTLFKRNLLKCKFLRLWEVWSKFVKFFMSILKRQVNSSSNFASFFIVVTHNSSVNFKLIHCLLWIKGSPQSPKFETFECSGENLPNSLCHFPNHKSVFLQILHHSSLPWNISPLHFFSSNIMYSDQKEPIQFLRLLSARVKICQIPHINFETTSQFLFKFCIILHCHDR